MVTVEAPFNTLLLFEQHMQVVMKAQRKKMAPLASVVSSQFTLPRLHTVILLH